MLLCELMHGVSVLEIYGGSCGDDDVLRMPVTGIATDSSSVLPGDVFVCIGGRHTDGHLYAGEAVRRGAAAIVAQRRISSSVPVLTVESTRSAAAFMWNNRFRSPADKMKIIAVTGTNGKTSVSYMIRQILTAAGHRCGLIGTVKCYAGEKELSVGGGSEVVGASAAMTTPDPRYLYGMLWEMRLAGVTHVVMEASSHALSQRKLDPLKIDIAVFTGLSPEHLDYHGTMENYLSAKSVLFRHAERSIINCDGPYADRIIEVSGGKIITVGTENDHNVTGRDIVCSRGRVEYTLETGTSTFCVECPMPGKFGLYNSLLAAAASLEAGVSTFSVREGLRCFGGVPGRMETVARYDGVTVIRDFAHTPEALRGAAEIAAADTEGRLWLVFGCGGDRDRSKRPEMGKIASKTAGFTVITSDNPRSEDKQKIISDIMRGFDKTNGYAVIPDRRDAIRYAVINAEAGDTVLLCGKGHEDYEITSDGIKPFDEVEIVRQAVSERHNK